MGAGASTDFIPGYYPSDQYYNSLTHQHEFPWLQGEYGVNTYDGPMEMQMMLRHQHQRRRGGGDESKDTDADAEEEEEQRLMMYWLMDLGLSKVRACELSFQFYDHGIISCQHLACEYASDRKLLDEFIAHGLISPAEAVLITSSSLFVVANSLRGNPEGLHSIISAMTMNSRQNASDRDNVDASGDRIRRELAAERMRLHAEETQNEMMAILDSALSAASARLDCNNHGMSLIHHSELFGDNDADQISRRMNTRAPTNYNRDIANRYYNNQALMDSDGDLQDENNFDNVHGSTDSLLNIRNRLNMQPGDSSSSSRYNNNNLGIAIIKEWDAALTSSCVDTSVDASTASYISTANGTIITGKYGVVAAELPAATSSSTTIEIVCLPSRGSITANNNSAPPILSIGVACKSDYSSQSILNSQSAVVPCFGRTLGSCGLLFSKDSQPSTSTSSASSSSSTATIVGSIIENNLIIEQFGALLEGDQISIHVDMDFEVVQILLNGRLLWTFTSVLALVNMNTVTSNGRNSGIDVTISPIVGVTLSEGCAVKLVTTSNPINVASAGSEDDAAPSTSPMMAEYAREYGMDAGSTSAAPSRILHHSTSTGNIGNGRIGECPQPQISAVAMRRIHQQQREQQYQRELEELRARRERNLAEHLQRTTMAASMFTVPTLSMSASSGAGAGVYNQTSADTAAWYRDHMNGLDVRGPATASSSSGGNRNSSNSNNVLLAATISALHSKPSAANGSAPGNINSNGSISAGDDNNSGNGDANNICVVCMERPKCMVLLPCRHMCLCETCGQLTGHGGTLKQCPMCREEIAMCLKVFV
jgi:hypothetical protein